MTLSKKCGDNTYKRRSILPHLTEDSQKFLVLILVQRVKQRLIRQEDIKGIQETQECLICFYNCVDYRKTSCSHEEDKLWHSTI
jgi:hypothetical protein